MFGFWPGAIHFRFSSNELVNLGARWDAEWYLSIARDGYDWNGNQWIKQNVAFFPALPLSMRAASLLTGGDLLNAGLLVALVAFLFALIFLFRLAESLEGAPAAHATIWMLASYPFAIYFSAPYTEALFLLGTVAAFFYAGRGAWAAASMAGLLTGLSRPNGFLLAIPLGLLVAERWWRDRTLKPGNLLIPLAPILGLAAFASYLYWRFGDALAWYRGQAGWGRDFRGVWDSIVTLILSHWALLGDGLLPFVQRLPYELFNACAALATLSLLWPIFRRYGLPMAAFVGVNVIPPLIMGGTMSIGRITSVMFPVFLWLGSAVPRRFHLPMIAAFCILQSLFAAAFFTWRPIY